MMFGCQPDRLLWRLQMPGQAPIDVDANSVPATIPTHRVWRSVTQVGRRPIARLADMATTRMLAGLTNSCLHGGRFPPNVTKLANK